MGDNGFVKRLESLMNRKNGKGRKITSYFMSKNIEGISQTAIDKYLSGKQVPGPEKIRVIAEFFHVSPGWLMFGEEKTPQFTTDEISVSTSEMWDVLKASVYNQNAQNDHIGKLLEMLSDKMAEDKKETAARTAV